MALDKSFNVFGISGWSVRRKQNKAGAEDHVGGFVLFIDTGPEIEMA